MKREIRTFEFDKLEIREGESGEKKISGHAAVFDKLSEDLGGFRERIETGAFSASIKHDDIRALFNHDQNLILGRNKAKTLRLDEDQEGLHYEVDPPDTSYAHDLMVSIERGDVNQGSFAFAVPKNGDSWEVDGNQVKIDEAFNAMWDGQKHDIIRDVKRAKLFDVSPVTYPAYPQTDVKVRSIFHETGIDFESISDILLRREQLTESDVALLNTTIEILRSYLPNLDGQETQDGAVVRVEGTPGDQETCSEAVGRVDIRRRKLELIKLK